jgi:hypothetical protein
MYRSLRLRYLWRVRKVIEMTENENVIHSFIKCVETVGFCEYCYFSDKGCDGTLDKKIETLQKVAKAVEGHIKEIDQEKQFWKSSCEYYKHELHLLRNKKKGDEQ